MNYMLEYRSRKATVNEIEQESVSHVTAQNEKAGNKRIPEVPLGFANASWEQFKTQIQEGDEIWYADHQWGPLCGWGGWLLVRRNNQGKEYVAANMTVRIS